MRADRDLVHVDRSAGEEHRAALGDGHHRDRALLAERGEPRPFQRVHGDIDGRAHLVPDLLAVVEHRRFVLLALADDDDAVHGDGVEHPAHAVHCRLVGGDLVATADPAARRDRPELRDADELERQVAVGSAEALEFTDRGLHATVTSSQR